MSVHGGPIVDPQSEARARLIFLGDPPAVHALARSMTIGRHPGNDIQILDAKVSKEHCIIEMRDDGFVLKDNGSMNGTFLNGAIVAGEARLKHLDIIRVGHACARFDDLRNLARVEPPLAASIASVRSPGLLGDARHGDAGHASNPLGLSPPSLRWNGPASSYDKYENRGSVAPPRPAAAHAPQPARAASDSSAPRPRDEGLRRRRQAALHRMMEARSIAAAADAALETACTALSAEFGATYLAAPSGEFVERSTRGGERGKATRLVSPTGLAYVTERRSVVVTLDADVPDASQAPGALGKRSAIAIPLRYWERVLGVVWVETALPVDVSDIDLDFADLVGKQAGLLLAVLEREVGPDFDAARLSAPLAYAAQGYALQREVEGTRTRGGLPTISEGDE